MRPSLAKALARAGVIAYAGPDRPTPRSPFAAVLVVGLLVIAARSAYAAPNVPDKARALAERGRASHESGDYGGAIAAFTEAYAIAPSPALLFNLAQAYRLRGSCDDAALMYRRYLDTAPSPEARTIAEDHLATVQRCAQKVALSIPLDDHERAAVPVVARQQDEAREDPGATKRRVGIGLVIAGGVTLVAAGYFALDAIEAENAVERGYANGGNGHDLALLDARGESSQTRATWLGIGGGALVVGGVTTYLLGRRADRATPVALVPRKGGAEVSFAWRF